MMGSSPDAITPHVEHDAIQVHRKIPHGMSDTLKPSLVRNAPRGLTIFGGSHIGRVREHNEDAWMALSLSNEASGNQTDVALLLLADGMGGHTSGDMASALAVRAAAVRVMQDVVLPFLSSEVAGTQHYALHETLVRSVETANAVVRHNVPQAGTTLTMALILGQRVYIAHVGDSRAYLLGKGSLRRITHDHSLAARLIETGQTIPEETSAHRNILYRAVGQRATIEVDTHTESFPDGSCLLLCSDGLWAKVSDAEIAEVLMNEPNAQAAVDKFIALANERGGDDNVTLILAVRNEA